MTKKTRGTDCTSKIAAMEAPLLMRLLEAIALTHEDPYGHITLFSIRSCRAYVAKANSTSSCSLVDFSRIKHIPHPWFTPSHQEISEQCSASQRSETEPRRIEISKANTVIGYLTLPGTTRSRSEPSNSKLLSSLIQSLKPTLSPKPSENNPPAAPTPSTAQLPEDHHTQYLKPGHPLNATREFFNSLADKTLEVTTADAVLIYQTDSNEEVIIPPIRRGKLLRPDLLNTKGPSHKTSLVFRMISYDKPFYARTAATDWSAAGLLSQEEQDGFVKREKILSSTAVPIKSQGKTYGVLFANYRKSQSFPRQLQLVIETFADLAGLAAHQAWRAHSSQNQAKQLAALNEISHQIAQPKISLNKTLQLVTARVAESAECDGALCFLADDATNDLDIVASYKVKARAGVTGLQLGQGVAGSVARDRKTIIENNYQSKKATQACLFEEGPIEGLLGVPILWSEELLGVLELISRSTNRPFSQDDKEIAENYASLTALAIAKAREDSLREAVIRQSPQAIIAVNRHGFITEFNEAATDILLWKKEEILGQPVSDLYWGRKGQARDLTRLLARQGSLNRIEVTAKSKDGRKVPVHLSATKLLDLDGRSVGTIGVVESLRKTPLPGKAAAVINSIEQITRPTHLKDLSETILLQSLELLEADAGILIILDESSKLHPLVEVVARDSKPATQLLRNLSATRPTEIELSHRGDSQAYFLNPDALSSVTIPLRGDEDLVGYLYLESLKEETLGPSQDLFNIFSRVSGSAIQRIQLRAFQEHARNQLLQSANAISSGIMATSLVHEISNTLNGLVLSIGNVGHDLSSLSKASRIPKKRWEKITDEFESLEEEVTNIASLTTSVRNSARSNMTPIKGPHSANALIKEVTRLLETHLNQERIKLSLELDPGLGEEVQNRNNQITVDPQQIRQVLINLILNAVAASRRGLKLLVTSKLQGSYAQFTVRDYGSGIPSEYLPEIFEPFFSRREGGTGLGLYVSKLIVEENHRGSLEVWSEPGRGSSFTIEIPIV